MTYSGTYYIGSKHIFHLPFIDFTATVRVAPLSFTKFPLNTEPKFPLPMNSPTVKRSGATRYIFTFAIKSSSTPGSTCSSSILSYLLALDGKWLSPSTLTSPVKLNNMFFFGWLQNNAKESGENSGRSCLHCVNPLSIIVQSDFTTCMRVLRAEQIADNSTADLWQQLLFTV